ncbi:MAG: hypothetical protein WAR22_08550 [Desulfomonilia bacterium]
MMRMRKSLLTIGCTIALAAGPCLHSDAVELEVAPLVGYALGGQFEESPDGADLDLDEAATLGLAVDFPLDEGRQIELYYSRQPTRLEADGEPSFEGAAFDIDVHYLQLGGTYTWHDQGTFRPYVAGSLGVTYLDPEPSNVDSLIRFSLGLGGGVRAFITERLGLRLDGRAFATLVENQGGGAAFSSDEGLSVAVSSDILVQFVFGLGVFFRL